MLNQIDLYSVSRYCYYYNQQHSYIDVDLSEKSSDADHCSERTSYKRETVALDETYHSVILVNGLAAQSLLEEVFLVETGRRVILQPEK